MKRTGSIPRYNSKELLQRGLRELGLGDVEIVEEEGESIPVLKEPPVRKVIRYAIRTTGRGCYKAAVLECGHEVRVAGRASNHKTRRCEECS